MKQEILEFKTKPVLYTCRSSTATGELVESSKKASNSGEFVLLLDYSKRAAERALPAFINARIRFSEGIARSGSMQMEMLLLICGTTQIGKALRECGMKNKENFMIFATGNKLLKNFAKANGIKTVRKIELKLDPKVAGNVAMTELLSE